MNIITPIILIIISLATFFGFIDPNYRGENLSNGNRSIKSLQAEDAEYQIALNNTNEIRKKREALVQKRGEIDPEDLQKLEKLLPDNIDNIKLVIDMNRIAQNHTLTLKNIKLETTVKTDSKEKIGQDNKKYGTVGLSFSVSSSYDNFQNFLNDLEKSLRLVDITDLSVTGTDSGVYDFSVSLKTYWLK
jgi:Tfp pilus assembly protein PilO